MRTHFSISRPKQSAIAILITYYNRFIFLNFDYSQWRKYLDKCYKRVIIVLYNVVVCECLPGSSHRKLKTDTELPDSRRRLVENNKNYCLLLVKFLVIVNILLALIFFKTFELFWFIIATPSSILNGYKTNTKMIIT